MAQDYVKLDNDQEYGMIAINKSVFESIADISIDEIENAVKLKSSRFSHPIKDSSASRQKSKSDMVPASMRQQSFYRIRSMRTFCL